MKRVCDALKLCSLSLERIIISIFAGNIGRDPAQSACSQDRRRVRTERSCNLRVGQPTERTLVPRVVARPSRESTAYVRSDAWHPMIAVFLMKRRRKSVRAETDVTLSVEPLRANLLLM
ncbi:MAG: hypothetical protein AAF449_01370, partial [Myxococcota bacterium]